MALSPDATLDKPPVERHYDNNPFCNGMQIHARALTNDSTLRIQWMKLPKGMGAGYNFDTNTIMMPAVNTVELTQEEVDKLKALSYHERLHHALSDGKVILSIINKAKKDSKKAEDDGDMEGMIVASSKAMFRKDLHNILEDARIEMDEHYRLPGDIENLLYYRTVLCPRDYFQEWREFQYMNPFGALMMAIKFTMPKYLDLEIIPELKKYWDDAMEILNDGRFHASCKVRKEGTEVMLTLTDEIMEKWQQEAENDPNMGAGMEVSGEGMEGDGHEGGEEGEGGSEGKEGKGKGKDGKGGKGKGKDGEGEGKGEGDSDKHEKVEPVKPDIGKKYGEDQEKNDGKWKHDPDSLNKEMGALNQDKSDPSDSTETRGNPYMKGPMKTPYIPYDVTDRVITAGFFPKEYSELRSMISDRIARTRNALTRILLAQSQSRTLNRQRRGHLDKRRLHCVVSNRPGWDRIFRKIEPATKLSTAVQLVIDLSGSMTHSEQTSEGNHITRAQLAAQIATLFGEALHVLKVPFEIIGYNTDGQASSVCEEMEKQGYTRVRDIVNKWVFKTFDENFIAVRDRLGACSLHMPRDDGWGGSHEDTPDTDYRSKHGCVGGCNVDHEVVQWGAGRLWSRKETRKIQIVLADGWPSGYNGDYGGQLQPLLKRINEKIVASGIEQFAFGIQCDDVKEYYARWKAVHELSDLTEECLRLLALSLNYNPSSQSNTA